MKRYGLLTLLLTAVALSQTLEIPPAAVARGTAQVLRIVFKPGPDFPLASLQWELVYPESLLIEPGGIAAGSTTESAGKSLTCAPRSAQPKERALVCIVAAGQQPVPEGTIALMRFVAGTAMRKGVVMVRLEKAAGVTAAAKLIPIPPTSGTITIH